MRRAHPHPLGAGAGYVPSCCRCCASCQPPREARRRPPPRASPWTTSRTSTPASRTRRRSGTNAPRTARTSSTCCTTTNATPPIAPPGTSTSAWSARLARRITLEFRNLDNVWNGRPGSVAGELKTVATSPDGQTWTTVPTDALPGNRVRVTLTMPGPVLYVARMQPYRLSDLDRLLARVRASPHASVTTIGQTAQGRPLEIIRIGSEPQDDRAGDGRARSPNAPNSQVMVPREPVPVTRDPAPGDPPRRCSCGRGRTPGRRAATGWRRASSSGCCATMRRRARGGSATCSTCCRWPTRTAWPGAAPDSMRTART